LLAEEPIQLAGSAYVPAKAQVLRFAQNEKPGDAWEARAGEFNAYQ